MYEHNVTTGKTDYHNGEYETHNVEHINDQLHSLNFHMLQKYNVTQKQSKWFVDLPVEGKQSLTFKIGTGAECSVITKETYEVLKVKPKVFPSKAQMKGIFGPPQVAPGYIMLPVCY